MTRYRSAVDRARADAIVIVGCALVLLAVLIAAWLR